MIKKEQKVEILSQTSRWLHFEIKCSLSVYNRLPRPEGITVSRRSINIEERNEIPFICPFSIIKYRESGYDEAYAHKFWKQSVMQAEANYDRLEYLGADQVDLDSVLTLSVAVDFYLLIPVKQIKSYANLLNSFHYDLELQDIGSTLMEYV